MLPDYLWGIETRCACSCGRWRYKASRLPMRNWNIRSPMNRAIKTPLPDYLWGIETRKWCASRLRLSGFQTTYEELKQGYGAGGRHICLGFQTTYEELKPSPSLCPHLLFRVASRLPMRNWNILRGLIRLIRRCFQTTYEELKPHRLRCVSHPTFSCFQTTYEELKSETGNATRKCSLLPDYLWGIETILCGLFAYLPNTLPDYLWGIETRDPRSRSSRSFRFQTTYEELKPKTAEELIAAADGFQTTYEELKRCTGEQVTTRSIASRLPMRNWNNGNVNHSGLISMLPDYLWGIETHWRTRGKTWYPRFQTTYEELKLDPGAPSQSLSVSASRLPMRNWNPRACPRKHRLRQASRLPMRNWNS